MQEGREARSDDEIVKAYEISKGKLVHVEDEDFEAAQVEGSHTFDIAEFVPMEEIDPIYFERSYYLAPQDGGEKVYTLLVRAMDDAGLVGGVAPGGGRARRRGRRALLRAGHRPGHLALAADAVQHTLSRRAVPRLARDDPAAAPAPEAGPGTARELDNLRLLDGAGDRGILRPGTTGGQVSPHAAVAAQGPARRRGSAAGYGILLLTAEGWASDFWPWQLVGFHGRVCSAVFITLAAGAVIVARSGSAIERRTLGLAALVLGCFAIVALAVVDADVNKVHWSSAATIAWLAMFSAVGVSGAGLLAVSARTE